MSITESEVEDAFLFRFHDTISFACLRSDLDLGPQSLHVDPAAALNEDEQLVVQFPDGLTCFDSDLVRTAVQLPFSDLILSFEEKNKVVTFQSAGIKIICHRIG